MMEYFTKRLMHCKDIGEVFKLMDSLDERVVDGLFASLNISQNSVYHRFNVREHIAYTVLSVVPCAELKWAALLHDIGKVRTLTTDLNGINHFYDHPNISASMAEDILVELNCDLKTLDNIVNLVRLHDKFNDATKPIKIKRVRELIGTYGTEFAYNLVQLKIADIKAQSEFSYQYKKDMILELHRLIHIVDIDGTGVNRYELDLDIAEFTDRYKEYTDKIIDILLRNVWGNPDNNENAILLRIADKEYKRMVLNDRD